MKFKNLILLAIIFVFAKSSSAQNNQRERIESIKIGFITKKLDLTPAESQNFWPVYNQYQDELKSLLSERKALKNSNSLQAVDNNLEIEESIVLVRKKYRKEFSKVLNADKINQLYLAEREFKEELIRQLKNRRNNDR